MNISKTRDTVLDLFDGPGTTLIACEQAGRWARLIELEPKYCDVIVRRWGAFTGGQARREGACPGTWGSSAIWSGASDVSPHYRLASFRQLNELSSDALS